MPRLDGATEWSWRHAGSRRGGRLRASQRWFTFWSMSCGLCKDNLPRVAEWRDTLRERGLRVIAVHMPRYETDTDVESRT